MNPIELTRRDVMTQTAVTGLVALAPPALAASPPAPITLRVNGRAVVLEIEPRVTLLDALRLHAGLPGTKKGCGRGSCGACTVHIDGRRVNACLTLAIRAQGHEIVTIEGLAEGEQLHPMQASFRKHDAFQCGYCTPGQIMAAVALVREGHAGSAGEIREWMTGNICRCGAYDNIVAAVADVASSETRAG